MITLDLPDRFSKPGRSVLTRDITQAPDENLYPRFLHQRSPMVSPHLACKSMAGC